MKIKTKLMILLSLSSLVTSLCIIFVYTELISAQVMDKIKNDLNVIATIEKKRIINSIDQSYRFLATNTARPNMILHLENYIVHNDPTDQENLYSVLDSIKNSGSQVRRVSLLSPAGIIMASSDRSYIKNDLSKTTFFIAAKNGSDYYELSKFEDNTLGIRLAAPLYHDDKFIGVITIVLEPDEIIDFNYDILSKSGDVYLVKKETADTILFLTPSKFDKDAAFNKRIAIGHNPSTKAVAGEEGVFLDLADYRGIDVLSATKYIEKTNWGLVVKIDANEALAPIDNIRNFTVVLGGGLTIVLLIATYYFSRMISRPIGSLQKATEQIALGNYIKTDVKSDDEIGELAKSFNSMSEALKNTAELRLETERLKEIDKEKEEFSAMISHELKTPLSPIQGYSELLMKGRLGELTEMQKNAAKTIFDNATRLLRLIQDILDIRKMELGRLNLAIRDTNAKEIIDQCLTAFKTTAQSKNITLVDNSQDIPIQCDPERIIQVINNLLSNAFKFVPQENGKIEVSTKIDNHSVIFSVKDNGIGIPKDKQDNLFQKFYQVDTTIGRKMSGSGLGLVICKGIIESHKGQIWLESESGKGTIIYFSIPNGMI